MLGFEYLTFGKRDGRKDVVIDVKDVVDQMKIHILVHISLFKALTGDAGSQKEVRLDIDVISSMLFILKTPIKIFLIGLKIGGRNYKLIHLLF